MVLTAMQPYFFPYIGYFQLLQCSDVFVLYDTAQYIKGGWVNRNRILINQEPFFLTFPVQKASHKLPINQRFYVPCRYNRTKIMKCIHSAYHKTAYFEETYPLIMQIMNFYSNNVGEFNHNLIRSLADYLGIKCLILPCSELELDSSLTGQERIIAINSLLGSCHYVNSIGGVSLYQEQSFAKYGIELSFLRPKNYQYLQFAEPFVSGLSILDLLMFRGQRTTSLMLMEYDMIKPTACQNG